MKRLIAVILCVVIMAHAAGCAGNMAATQEGQGSLQAESGKAPLAEIRKQAKDLDTPYENLDLSKAKITIPEVDEVYDLTFPTSTDSFERQIEKLQENIRKYEGIGEDVDLTQYMSLMYWDLEKDDRLTIPIREATDQQKKEVQYVGYNDGKCSQLLVFSNFMLELGDYSVPTKLTGDTEDYSQKEYGYRGYELGKVVEEYKLPDDDISGVSYHLSDGDVALTDAISFVEQHMQEDYYFAGSKLLGYYVFGVEVRELSDGVYYYEFDVGTTYKGVGLNKDDGMETPSEEELKERGSLDPVPFGTSHFVAMFQKDRLGFIWSCCQNFESVKENQAYQELLPLEEACRLLSNYISNSKPYQIRSIELIYQTEFEYEDEDKKYWGYVQSVHANPAYHFKVVNTGMPGYNNLCFDVNAVSGEITTMN